MRAWLLATLIGAAAVDVFIVYQVPMLTRAGLPFEIAATIAGFRGLAQLAGRLPLGKLIRHLGVRTTVMLCNIVGAIAALLLFAGGTLAAALALSFLAGASIGALDALQGIYTHELAGPHDLGTLLGAQRAVFGAGGATGPVAAGALVGATGSYTPTIVIITTGFVAAACVLLLDVGRDRTAGTVPQC